MSPSEVRREPHGEPPRVEMALGMSYLRAVERAGGLPVVLPPLELDRISPLLDRLSGVLLSGGPDLDPAAYGRAAHPELGPTEPQLDVFEVQLAREADARGLPILGICRGAQALNIARGGTLHQHLPEITDGSIVHRQSQPGKQATHEVRIAARSGLAAVVGLRRGWTSTPFTTSPSSDSATICTRSHGRRTASSRASKGGASRSCWGFSGTPRRWSTIPRNSPSSDTWWQPPRSESESARRRGASVRRDERPERWTRSRGARAQPGAAGRHPRNGGRGPSGSRRR